MWPILTHWYGFFSAYFIRCELSEALLWSMTIHAWFLQGFNREIEDIHRVQKAFSIPDTELRYTLREDNKQFILPFYTAFLQRYQSMPFSRNPEKYIKYGKDDVCRFIDGFFDAASWTLLISLTTSFSLSVGDWLMPGLLMLEMFFDPQCP